MAEAERYGFYVQTAHGTAKTVVSHTDGLSPEEIARRERRFHETANNLYRQMVRRKAAEQEVKEML